jgi:hypothetical protein
LITVFGIDKVIAEIPLRSENDWEKNNIFLSSEDKIINGLNGLVSMNFEYGV